MKTLALLLAAATLAACSTPDAQHEPGTRPGAGAAAGGASGAPGAPGAMGEQVPPHVTAPPAPWTEAFLGEAALIAAEVRIEGPPELRDHLAVQQDPDHHTYTIKTVAEGLRQETHVRAEFIGDHPVRCQLDNLTVLAERAVIVLERPIGVPVTVSAVGDAYWRDATTGEERRGASLVLRGDEPR